MYLNDQAFCEPVTNNCFLSYSLSKIIAFIKAVKPFITGENVENCEEE